MPDFTELARTLRITPATPDLLKQALVHSSYINENPGFELGHNERLEFLGDAVLDFIVAEKLYRDFPDLAEGEMTRLRAALVRRETLAGIARRIGLGAFLYLGKGEEATGGRDKTANLAGAMEAVIAAVYLDQGLPAARELVIRLLRDAWAKAMRQGADFKSRLQEVVQARFQLTPEYYLVGEAGPDHDKTFTVEVSVGGRTMGSGTGKSKKLAEGEAARLALERLKEGFTA